LSAYSISFEKQFDAGIDQRAPGQAQPVPGQDIGQVMAAHKQPAETNHLLSNFYLYFDKRTRKIKFEK